MKTVKEFIEEYALNVINKKYDNITCTSAKIEFVTIKEDVKKGIEFAQQWIDVSSNEFPDNPDEVVLVKDMADNVYTAVWEHNAWYITPFHTDVMIENVKYWRPIERK